MGRRNPLIIIALLIFSGSALAGPAMQQLMSGLSTSAVYDFTSDAYCDGGWHMEDSTTETDLSSNSEDLTVSSGDTIPTSSDVPSGYSGNSRDFELDDDEWLEHADGGSTDVSGANQNITLAAWVKLESNVSDSVIMSKWEPGGGLQYILRYESSDDTWRFELSSDGSTISASCYGPTGAYSAATWVHVAGSYNDTDMRLYVDGVLATNGANNPKSYTSGIYDGSARFMIGAREPGSQNLDGLIKDAIIFERALTAGEISGLKTNGIEGDKS